MMPIDPAPAVPTLVLVPAHDQFGPPEAVAPLVAACPQAEMDTIAWLTKLGL